MNNMWEKELKEAISAGLKAKEKILEIYNAGFDVEIKEDNSPVTLADKSADKIIREHLHKACPNHAFLTEESEDNKDRLDNDFVWIVDPVDGTKDFVARDGGFTTNIALAYKHEVVVGVVIVPVTGDIYYATKDGGAFHEINGQVKKIHVNNKTEDLTVLRSVFHFNEKEQSLIDKHSDRIKHVEKYGSSLKPCRIAEGLAEITYRISGGTKEWDTAAGHVILNEAGGEIIDLTTNQEMVYDKASIKNNFFVAKRKGLRI